MRKPDWADPKTVEWCAGVCDAIAARSVLHDRRRGAESCASILRLMIDSYKPSSPEPLGGVGGVPLPDTGR